MLISLIIRLNFPSVTLNLCLFFKVTPVVPLSNDSWSMSFAKYLELRFYGHQYTRRANAEPCGHSIHKDYHQYFSYNQMVASFRLVSRHCVLYPFSLFLCEMLRMVTAKSF